MKESSDIIQIMLSDGTFWGFLFWLVLMIAAVQIVKLCLAPVRLLLWAWRNRMAVLIRPSKSGFALVVALAFVCWVFRSELTDGIQYMEQLYISPAYVSSDTSQHVVAIYEQEMARYLDRYELEIVRRRTEEIAALCGSSPLSIYEVAYSECGMDPFIIRKDGIAAGWIQFTTAGLNGLTISGQPATLQAVKDACRRRDTELIMDLTRQYFVTRAKGVALPRSVDVYTCVFAPGHIGKPDAFALYQGWGNPSYYLNKGLDGYYVKSIGGQPQIFRSNANCDGKITIADMDLALQYKKSRLIQQSRFKG